MPSSGEDVRRKFRSERQTTVPGRTVRKITDADDIRDATGAPPVANARSDRPDLAGDSVGCRQTTTYPSPT